MHTIAVAWLRVRLRDRLREKSPWLRELREIPTRAYMSKNPLCISLTATKNTRNRATRVTTRVDAQPLALPAPISRNHPMSEKRKGGLRDEMPDAAALMDEIRALMGREWADEALRQGMCLQREHAARVASLGQAKADAWLDAQRSAAPALSLSERGATVGMLPGRRPQR